jgi:hypothetical protein
MDDKRDDKVTERLCRSTSVRSLKWFVFHMRRLIEIEGRDSQDPLHVYHRHQTEACERRIGELEGRSNSVEKV